MRGLRIKALFALIACTPLKSGQELPNGVELLFGIGSYFRPTATDYTINNGFIQAKNLGRFAPQGLVGLGFEFCTANSTARRCRPHKWAKYLSTFASAQFGSDTNSTVTGYTLGLGIELSRYFHVLAGYSLIPVGQPAPGFQRAAASWVRDHPREYATFDPANLGGNNLNAFDGFPLPQAPGLPGSAGGFVYGGNILESRYQPGFFFGIAFPLNLRASLHAATGVTVAPGTVSLGASEAETFAALTADASGVTWSINPDVGRITPVGRYSAPALITAVQTVTVTATSASAGIGSATIALHP
ncbi:MAG: hypothetical protein C5B51_18845 [Terriglobia bacterium]|nr:MAG: hypothetical protein C5B51_18845 [Terriglobia bacterium]